MPKKLNNYSRTFYYDNFLCDLVCLHFILQAVFFLVLIKWLSSTDGNVFHFALSCVTVIDYRFHILCCFLLVTMIQLYKKVDYFQKLADNLVMTVRFVCLSLWGFSIPEKVQEKFSLNFILSFFACYFFAGLVLWPFLSRERSNIFLFKYNLEMLLDLLNVFFVLIKGWLSWQVSMTDRIKQLIYYFVLNFIGWLDNVWCRLYFLQLCIISHLSLLSKSYSCN